MSLLMIVWELSYLDKVDAMALPSSGYSTTWKVYQTKMVSLTNGVAG